LLRDSRPVDAKGETAMRLSHRWAASVLAGALTVLASLASADDAQVPAGVGVTPTPVAVAAGRPRIGLVLGGGGAKGGAHIGVIKVLEEMHIPVDCIAGTSMGSIVGAAYATGASAGELEKIVTSISWREVLANVPRQDEPYHRKYLDAAFTNNLELGIKDEGIVAPGGLLPTHQIEGLFRSIVANAGGVSDFNKLPIPFRAVSTDLESGEVMVWDSGDLAQAMRASMAVPGVFAPVKADDHIYVDGMLVRNLPVDVARQTCADVVIVVPLSNPPPPRKSLNSLLGVASQSMNIAIEANERAQLATLTDKDVEIPVVLKGITSGDFDKVPETIPIGEAAARKLAAKLARYSMTPQAYAAWRAGLPRINGIGAVRIDEVRVAGYKITNPEVIKTVLHVKAGDTYDPNAAAADTDRLVARGDYVAADYRMEVLDGRNVLTYTVTEKPWGPNYLQVDLNLSTDFHGQTAWGVRADVDQRWLNSLGGELRSSLQLGEPNVFDIGFYQPLEKTQTFFVSPSFLAQQSIEYIYQNDDPALQLDVRRLSGYLDAGIAFGSWGEFRLGLERGSVTVKQKIGDPLVTDPTGTYQIGGIAARFGFDTLDRRIFPTTGSLLLVRAYDGETGLGSDANYRLASEEYQTTLSLGLRNNWTLFVRSGSDFGSHAPYYDQYQLGGLFNFSGYQINELIGREYALGVLQFRRAISVSGTSDYATFIGGSIETGNVWNRLDGTSPGGAMVAGSVFLAVSSKLGPVYLAYGHADHGVSALYLYLGSSLDFVRH
jgi:NTE family protein